MSKHTPLPWRQHPLGGTVELRRTHPACGPAFDYASIAIGSGDTIIAELTCQSNFDDPTCEGFPRPRTLEELTANAELILRAVNAFAAALRVVDTAFRYDGFDTVQVPRDAMEALHAAVRDEPNLITP